MLADVAVEAQRAVFSPLDQAFALQKVNRQYSGMAAVAAAERQRTISKSGERSDRAPTDCDDLGCPAEIGVAHGDRAAGMAAPHIGLQIREVGVPGDVDTRRGIAGRGQEGAYLRLVTLEQYDLDGDARLLVKVASHAFPDRHHLGIVRDGTHPDRSAHGRLLVRTLCNRSFGRSSFRPRTALSSCGFALRRAAFPRPLSR